MFNRHRNSSFWSRNGELVLELAGVSLIGLALYRKWHEHQMAKKASSILASRGYWGGV